MRKVRRQALLGAGHTAMQLGLFPSSQLPSAVMHIILPVRVQPRSQARTVFGCMKKAEGLVHFLTSVKGRKI